jgi:DNA topoisomerase VI subunit B
MTTTTAPILQRTTFTSSRAMEFFSEKELQLQIGHERDRWPLALVKELIDNSLDACEAAGTPPEITITVRPNVVSVRDNGPGLPETTIQRSLDYLVRVSDKAAYVSPTRGQLGNALKVCWAAPFVVDGRYGRVDVATGGVRYRLAVTVDQIKQAPDLRIVRRPSVVRTGTDVRLHWPQVAKNGSRRSDFYFAAADAVTLIRFYALANPHATFHLRIPGGDEAIQIERTRADWAKWSPHDPTSPHWYSPARLAALIAAYVASEEDGGPARTVREFVAEFAGLSGSVKLKQVTAAAGLTGASLHDLVRDGVVDPDECAKLLTAMQDAGRPIKPAALGALGETHLRTVLITAFGATETSIRTRKVELTIGGVPYLLEVGFGINDEHSAEVPRQVAIALNWSPSLGNPIPRLAGLLGEARLDLHDPVSLVVHLACPRLEYVDRGKTQLALPTDVSTTFAETIRSITKAWTQTKRQADRDNRVRERDLERARKPQQRQKLSVKEAAWRVMERAYRHAAGTTGMAGARQVMYAARPLVLSLTGGEIWKHDSYFTQTLLPDFIEAHPDLTADWDVVYDARGHLIEPHTGRRVPLGTVEVRDYIAAWKGGAGPRHRYAYALFIEKEGFSPLLERALIAERFDVAIMSTKGMSVTAARLLIDHLSQCGVTILVARDFDKSGFTIARTIADDSRRYRYSATPSVRDLGLRLPDIEAMGLTGEPVHYSGDADPRVELQRCGATVEERAYLVHPGRFRGWVGERVELNAMTSDQFIAWIEQKLTDAGVHKVVPDANTLDGIYCTTVHSHRRQAVIDAAVATALEGFTDEPVEPPPDLHSRVEAALPLGTTATWEDIVRGYATSAAGGAA